MMNMSFLRKVVSKPRMERFDASRVRSRLEERGLSGPEFAREVIRVSPRTMRVHPNYITEILRGDVKKISSDYLTLFAKVLDCHRDDLFSEGMEA
jgi:transcriptional regulator with XRE-family HTH domain